MSKHEREAVAVLGCDSRIPKPSGGPCDSECRASAPIRGDSQVELEQAHRAARLAAVLLAESLGWDVAPHGKPQRDLCPTCKAAEAVIAAAKAAASAKAAP